MRNYPLVTAVLALLIVNVSFAGESHDARFKECNNEAEQPDSCSGEHIIDSLSPLELDLVDLLSADANDEGKRELFLNLKHAEVCTQASILSEQDAGPDADWLVQQQLSLRAEYASALAANGHQLPPLELPTDPGPNPPVLPYAHGTGIQGSPAACMGAIAAADAAVVAYYAACKGFRRFTPTCAAAGIAALGTMGTAMAICEYWFRSLEEQY